MSRPSLLAVLFALAVFSGSVATWTIVFWVSADPVPDVIYWWLAGSIAVMIPIGIYFFVTPSTNWSEEVDIHERENGKM